MSSTDTKERMLTAAILLIEREGVAQLTVRAVAREANVNVAAVSYHFGSKRALIACALEGAIQHMIADSREILAGMSADPANALEQLLTYYLEGARRYPRITKAHLHAPLDRDDYSGPFPVLMGPFAEDLRRAIQRATGVDKKQATDRTMMALSATLFPAFFGPLLGSVSRLDTPAARRRYVREVTRRVLAT